MEQRIIVKNVKIAPTRSKKIVVDKKETKKVTKSEQQVNWEKYLALNQDELALISQIEGGASGA